VDDSTRFFHTARPAPGLDVLSVVKGLGQRGCPARILAPIGERRLPARERGSPDQWPRASGRTNRTTVIARRCTASVIGCGRAPAERSSAPVDARAARGSPSERRGRRSVRSRDVRRVLDDGRPLHGNRVIVFLAPGTGAVAFVAGRKVGTAVDRNRARRILRAAWSDVARGIGNGYDAVLVARTAIRGAKTQDLVAEMTELLRGATS
jgi:ribonuclease P protein component